MVARENYRTFFGDIVEIDNVNAAKKRIGDDTNKPDDKALKHVTNQETPRASHFAVSTRGCQFRNRLCNTATQSVCYVKVSACRGGLCCEFINR